MEHKEPLSAHLARTGGLTGEDLRHIANLERIAFAKTMAVTSNGKFPHWSIERWMSVLTFTSVLVGGIWFASTQWGDVKRGLDRVTADIESLRSSSAADRVRAEENFNALRKQIEAQRRR